MALARRLVIFALIVAVAAPLAPQLLWSVAGRWFFPALLPAQWSLRAWHYVMSPSSRVLEGLGNSLAIATAVSLLSLLAGLPAARAFALHDFPGKGLLEWLLMLPIVVPGLVSAMGIHIAFIRLGLAGTYAGVTLSHLIPCMPYMIMVMTGVFANYGTSLEDAARTLGAGRFRVLWEVSLPGVSAGLGVAFMFTFLVSWGQYATTLLIGEGRIVTLPIVLFPFVAGSDQAVAAAIGLVFVAPALLVLAATSRSLAEHSFSYGGFGRL